MQDTKTTQTAKAINAAAITIADEISTALSNEINRLREGDFYGDSLPDSLADIAKSLRILSGREKL